MGVSDGETQKRCLDLDGNTKSKNKAGRSGNGSSIASNTVRFADRRFQAEKFDECNALITSSSVLPPQVGRK